MIKLFRYIENTWVGDDGKPSVKRILAIAFSIHILYSVSTTLRAFVLLVDVAYFKPKTIGADMILAAGSSLSSLAMVLGIEAGLVAALLGLASYQSIQQSIKTSINDLPRN